MSVAELLAGECKRCGECAFPPVDRCEACGSAGPFSSRALSPSGSVYTLTTIHVPSAGFATPYTVAYVDFPEGPRLFGHVVGGANIGSEVEATLAAVPLADGTTREQLVFRVHP